MRYEGGVCGGVGVVSWPVSSLSNATVTLIPRVLLWQCPLEEVI